MSYRRFLLFCVAFMLLIAVRPATSLDFARAKLGNGLTVIVVEDNTTDLAAIDIWVSAGSVNETPENNGVSHLIEHLVFAGSKKYEPGEIDFEAESLGATLDAHTTRDWARFSTTVASRCLDDAIALMAEMIINPTFPEESLRREKMIILDEIARKNSINRKVCDDNLWMALMGSHPYSLPIEGSAANIRSLTRDQIIAHYSSLYTADNTTIVIVGDVDGQRAVDAVGKYFEDMPRTAKLPNIPDLVPVEKQEELELVAGGGLGCIGIGYVGPAAAEYDDVCAVDLLLAYMGFGYLSWMEEELISKTSLASGTWADFLTHQKPGLISLTVIAENKNFDAIKESIFKKVDEIIANGVAAPELERARRSLLGQFAFQNETFEGQANTLGFYDRISNANFGKTYIERIRAVTNENIKHTAAKYMSRDKAAIVMIKTRN